MNWKEMLERIKEMKKKSEELYEEMKNYLRNVENDYVFLEMCIAVKYWEEMDYHLVEVKDFCEEKVKEKGGRRYICSVCKKEFEEEDCNEVEGWLVCPSCGGVIEIVEERFLCSRCGKISDNPDEFVVIDGKYVCWECHERGE